MHPTTATPRPGPTTAATEAVSARQLEWLRSEIGQWQAEDLLSHDQGERILRRYHPTRSFSLTRLLLGVGASFVGVGLIWLVAANLEGLAPTTRFLLVAALWLALLVGAETLAGRAAPRLAVGAVRLMAAFAVGAVIFQAAQSLQVPAYEPRLVGLWGVAALLQAYAFRAAGPLLVGVAGVTGWSVWHGLSQDPTFADVVLVTLGTGVAALGVAALHEGRDRRFSAVWRTVGAGFALVGAFIAALPVDERLELSGAWWHLVLWLLVAAALVAAVVRSAHRLALVEVLGAAGFLGVSLLLVQWPGGTDPDQVGLNGWLHTALAVVAYVGLAVGVAVAGTLRDSRVLPGLATLGLVVFTTFQAFAVFAPIMDGAWLFLFLGLVFLATGWGFDRTRRTLAAAIDDETLSTTTTPRTDGENR